MMTHLRSFLRNGKVLSTMALVLGLFVSAFSQTPGDSVSGGFTTEDVAWTNGEIKLAGRLYLPKGSGPFPAVVMLHGSGSLTIEDRMYREHGERLVKAGLAVLIFDKRGVGRSTGDWKAAALVDLAGDAERGVELLRANQKIDPKRVGLLGLSQGAWVATIMASRLPNYAFLIWVSGAPITPAEQGHYIVESTLRKKNHDDAAVKKALELDRYIVNVYRTDSGWEEAAKKIAAAETEPWFRDSSIGIQPKDSWNWKWYSRFFDYDPLPDLKKSKLPMFAAYGEADPIMPVARSIAMLGELRTGSGIDVTTLTVPAVGHDLSIRRGPQPEQYWSEIAAWLASRKITVKPVNKN